MENNVRTDNKLEVLLVLLLVSLRASLLLFLFSKYDFQPIADIVCGCVTLSHPPLGKGCGNVKIFN